MQLNPVNCALPDEHVPSDSDWNTLIAYLGGESAAAVKLNMTGTEYVGCI